MNDPRGKQAWPLASKYQEAIQNHSRFLGDLELCQGTVDSDSNTRMPLVFSGGYAAVFRLTCGEHKFALKCFLSEIPNRMARYSEISQFISNNITNTSESTWANFSFLERGILVGGIWYPALKMEWVDGLELNRYIAQQIDDNKRLENLAAQFLRLTKQLEDKSVAHGDLQHGNIIVKNDVIRLVDYDDMYLPSLKNEEGSGLGHSNYTHPLRRKQDYGPDIDNFSSIVIYLSIVALSKDKSLWPKYHTGENLILDKDDYRDPENSSCFKDLRNSNDAFVAKLAIDLSNYCHIRPQNIPSLKDILADKAVVVIKEENIQAPELLNIIEDKFICPHLNEIWEPGIGHDIVWHTSEDHGEIRVFLDHETRERRLITKAPSVLGSIFWTIPKFEYPGNSYRIVLQSARTDEIIQVSEQFTILSKAWIESIELFNRYDCSWCKDFYTTQPWQCFNRKIKLDQNIASGRQPQCNYISRISEGQRIKSIADERWWWLIYDSLHPVKF
jgi:hypothetical protein